MQLSNAKINFMQRNFLSPLLMVLVLTLILLTIVAIFYLYITAKNRERLALIEKGMNPNLARSDFWPQAGIIAGGISTGLVLSDMLPYTPYMSGPLLGIILAVTGLVIYNVARRSKIYRN